ncbi:hypothetical protein LR68_03410 [Anoxybacillus sp. BCO1]|nr:hypothetical protein LR68_03410 [Anoxybacillus sp. BCO1]
MIKEWLEDDSVDQSEVRAETTSNEQNYLDPQAWLVGRTIGRLNNKKTMIKAVANSSKTGIYEKSSPL